MPELPNYGILKGRAIFEPEETNLKNDDLEDALADMRNKMLRLQLTEGWKDSKFNKPDNELYMTLVSVLSCLAPDVGNAMYDFEAAK